MSDSENSQEPVFRQSGDSEWLIPPAITNAIPEFKGKIVCDAEAYAHIEKEHGDQIRGLGYATLEIFLDDSLTHIDEVYSARVGYSLVARVRGRHRAANRVVVYLKKSETGDFYDVGTAMPVRSDYFDKRDPLWERAQTNPDSLAQNRDKADLGDKGSKNLP